MISTNTSQLFRLRITVFLLLLATSFGLSPDGILLLSFKYSVLSDPLSVLEDWNYADETPCAWNGVMCSGIGIPGTPASSHVVSVVLPNSQLLGSIPAAMGMIKHLRHLDLSNNSLNGTLPSSLFNAFQLQSLSLSNNAISGKLPAFMGGLKSLEFLNISGDALAGNVPRNLTALPNLKVLSLSNNYLSGSVPGGFDALQILDLSSNFINGPLPPDFGGRSLRYLNLSHNNVSGGIPPAFAKQIQANATVDLSFNKLTGEIPESEALRNQKTESFAGNLDLCGKPLTNTCSIPSTLSTPPNVSDATSPPALAVGPKSIDSTPVTDSPGRSNETKRQGQGGLRPGKIVGIVVGDLAGVGLLGLLFVYMYQTKKRTKVKNTGSTEKRGKDEGSSSSSDTRRLATWSCLGRKGGDDDETSETTGSDSEEDEEAQAGKNELQQQQQQGKGGSLVTIDGETELELETLLKASAYIIGATGSSIVYKAVLENGATFAVRRIGESGIERFRDFENRVRLIAKLRHPNLVRIRGFYWGADEKLVIYDYVPNGSLATTSYKKTGSSPSHLRWENRLKIARGVARGLTYLHEKKHVHGNLKPSNVLLGSDLEPRISDFGHERLQRSDYSYKASGSARNFGSNRSTASRDSIPELTTGASPGTGFLGCASPYQAPDSLKSLKPNPKWDVYSFGVMMLELLTGKVFSDEYWSQWNHGFVGEERNRVMRMVDVAIRSDVEGKEEALLACFALGFSCASVVPQKRPSMKEALHILEKI